MNENAKKAIASVHKGQISMSKFITPNDVGATGGHQSGFHIHKSAYKVFFSRPGKKGENDENFIKIKWQDDIKTESRAIYYGTGTRNEYRLTRFGKNFPFLLNENIGDLLIMTKMGGDEYEAFILQTDDEMELFFDMFGMSPTDTNAIINKNNNSPLQENIDEILRKIAMQHEDFPSTKIVANLARDAFNSFHKVSDLDIKRNSDKIILDWLSTEYNLFKILENHLCFDAINIDFTDTDSFIKAANSLANRRKSRAGKSLELHLERIFEIRKLEFDTQVYTEAKKQPDFIFPGDSQYHNMSFASDKLVLLASKTTCKDRWRQVLNEADRIDTKHLFTLQQGISSNQLNEMYDHGIRLVVPKTYINTFPPEFRDRICHLDSFVKYVESKQK